MSRKSDAKSRYSVTGISQRSQSQKMKLPIENVKVNVSKPDVQSTAIKVMNYLEKMHSNNDT